MINITIAQAKASMVTSLTASNSSVLDKPKESSEHTPVESAIVNIKNQGALKDKPDILKALENRQQLYTEQVSALTGYQEQIRQMGGEADKLGSLSSSSAPAEIKASLKDFANKYNDMVDKQAGNFSSNGAFKDLQAAEYARFAMEREVDNVFNGSEELGFGGLNNAGISIDPNTKKMVIDEKQLDATLSSNKKGVLSGVADLAHKFKEATNVYTTEGKFISNRIDKLNEALNWLKENLPGIAAEYGFDSNTNSTSSKALGTYKTVQNF